MDAIVPDATAQDVALLSAAIASVLAQVVAIAGVNAAALSVVRIELGP